MRSLGDAAMQTGFRTPVSSGVANRARTGWADQPDDPMSGSITRATSPPGSLNQQIGAKADASDDAQTDLAPYHPVTRQLAEPGR
jgi:hypothetical protein